MTFHVLDVRPLQDCFEESLTREVELSAPLDEPLMRRVARGATLDYHPEFPRPYFRIERRGAYVAQGVLGNRTFRITLSPRGGAHVLSTLIEVIEKGETADGNEDGSVLQAR